MISKECCKMYIKLDYQGNDEWDIWYMMGKGKKDIFIGTTSFGLEDAERIAKEYDKDAAIVKEESLVKFNIK